MKHNIMFIYTSQPPKFDTRENNRPPIPEPKVQPYNKLRPAVLATSYKKHVFQRYKVVYCLKI